MTEFVPRSLTDILAYLLPGCLLVLAFVYTFAPSRLAKTDQRLGLGEMTAAVTGAYLLGIVLFRVSEIVIWPFSWWFGRGVLHGIITDFPNSQVLCDGLEAKVGVAFHSPVDCYRFASQVVQDRLPRSAEAAERLLAVGLMARSLLLAIPLVTTLIAWRFRKTPKFVGPVAAVVVGAVLEGVFAKVFLAHWSAAVWRFLRTYMVWQSLG